MQILPVFWVLPLNIVQIESEAVGGAVTKKRLGKKKAQGKDSQGRMPSKHLPCLRCLIQKLDFTRALKVTAVSHSLNISKESWSATPCSSEKKISSLPLLDNSLKMAFWRQALAGLKQELFGI